MFEKTNPRPTRYTGWVTWTFDALLPEESAAEEANPKEEAQQISPLEFAMLILPVLRNFPPAYHAVLAALRQRWPTAPALG